MFFRRNDYRRVPDNSDLSHDLANTSEKYVIHSSGMTATRWFTSFLLISLLTTLPIGFLCFKWGASAHETRPTQADWLSPLGDVDAVFRYQQKFTLHPDNETDALWDSIFPTDTNLEPLIEGRGGVNGFGAERKCRDFGRLSAWADKWRVEEL
ncbi:hypothetical protein EKO27_g2432 [Xylaria grammica]|uniref:Uncharacterized protein n=1 Tax=Xylaria grammica TaxID=363999 RepID=A0A439DE16_9PEZI|nr:hypothetical protein EKO27_g2432 [Xylaria grammica]